MGTPFMGEIRVMSFNFPPKGWAQCNGQLLPINQNQALFSLLGTNYGGNGQTTFGLPDLRARVPVYTGLGFTLGQRSGETAHTLSVTELPAHQHVLQATATGAAGPIPTSNLLATSAATDPLYSNPAGLVNLDSSALATVGGGQAHPNMQPYLVLNFCIALQGIFPSRN